jgi:hypothetical protein
MIPDATYASAIEPFPTSNRFALAIGSASASTFSGESDGTMEHPRIAAKGFAGPAHPPHIILLEVAGVRRRR